MHYYRRSCSFTTTNEIDPEYVISACLGKPRAEQATYNLTAVDCEACLHKVALAAKKWWDHEAGPRSAEDRDTRPIQWNR